jgi:glycosyltransferase involved in cell wall biosynthesis
MMLSVIVPARDEERVLGVCLESLVAQAREGFGLGVEWELIVVDDHSADGTRAIAEGMAGVQVMGAPELGGMTGKNNACWAGARASRGAVLLFTDADTVHAAGGLERALREMREHGVAMLSYSPRQMVVGFWQHAVMPLVFSELASVYPPKEVNDPESSVAAANGQFLMVEREAYFSVGGHGAVGTKVLEDVALARLFKESGEGIWFRYGPEVVAARMYGSASEMMRGWRKNLALLFPQQVALVFWRILDLLLFAGLPVLVVWLWWLTPLQRGLLMLVWLRTVWRFYRRVARSHFPVADVAVSILGVPLFSYMLLASAGVQRRGGRVSWKGRSYDTSA